jgi:8-oxo-dGTP pyrophosphatase MutT (NUDIX family)
MGGANLIPGDLDPPDPRSARLSTGQALARSSQEGATHRAVAAGDIDARGNMIKHATAGAFLLHQESGQWRLGLIEHPRLGRWMIPGGHVEIHESQAEAALREVTEETGLTAVTLLQAPSPQFPPHFPGTHTRVPLPWWITEVAVGKDNHLDEDHIHVDHQYVAVVNDPLPAAVGEHPFNWVTHNEILGLPMFEDTRVLTELLFSTIDDVTAGNAHRVLAHHPVRE